MKNIVRMMTNICSDDLIKSSEFYTTILDLKINFESDWFVHLISGGGELELGLVKRTHDIVPEGFQEKPQGFYMTFVVENADTIHDIAIAHNLEVVSKPVNTNYGQRRLLLRDPDGALIDISSPIPSFNFN